MDVKAPNTCKRSCLALFAILLLLYNCSPKDDLQTEADELVYGPYRLIKLPIDKGITIINPVKIALGPQGKIFAANQSGEIYILNDTDADGLEDDATLYANISDYGLHSPTGFTHRGDTVYIGTREEIRIFLDKDHDGKADTSWTFFKDFPHSSHPYEWTSGLCFGKDGWLYFNLTTDSWNAGASIDRHALRGAILRVSPDGKQMEKIATGIRSVPSMTFNEQGDLFFIDNEGGGNPHEELNLLQFGAYYGHNPQKYPEAKITTDPVYTFDSEVAPSGMVFNSIENDFGGTAGDLFVAFYGPGERWTRGAVARLRIVKQDNGTYTFEEQAIADIPKLSDLAFGANGELYLAHHGLSDYWYNVTEEKTGGFYKLVFDPALEKTSIKKRKQGTGYLAASSIERGKQIYAERACLACHAVDGETEWIGPNLKDAGMKFAREEILDEILYPSKIIKPSMIASRVIKKDGQIQLGRIVNADEHAISLMLIGNQVVQIPKNEIEKIEDERQSLMYENLLNGLSEDDVNSLLDYIMSLYRN
jgi:putative heme-binding domain-containing protein